MTARHALLWDVWTAAWFAVGFVGAGAIGMAWLRRRLRG